MPAGELQRLARRLRAHIDEARAAEAQARYELAADLRAIRARGPAALVQLAAALGVPAPALEKLADLAERLPLSELRRAAGIPPGRPLRPAEWLALAAGPLAKADWPPSL